MSGAAPFHADMARGPDGGVAFWRQATDGVRLRLGLWRGGGAGTVFLFPGRGEYVEKYGPTAAAMATAGLNTLTIDWRGQGLSDRLARDRRLGHVADFRHYQRDVAEMIAMAETMALPRPWYILSHSMGGTIALRTLIENRSFAAAVFSAPMWGLRIPPHLRPVAHIVSRLAHIGRQAHRLTPMTAAESYVLTAQPNGNLLTSDQSVFTWLRDQLVAVPELALGGPTLGWLRAALLECAWCQRVTPPDLLALTLLGSDEAIVATAPIHRIMARWPGGKLQLVAGARHELPMERAVLCGLFHDSAINFLRSHS
ncbi:alpha/beta fold hydrolase [Neogemmobacter tilapiae]|uniref:Hydrolase n=1 Tax=Neogemmobacter tilapiae TaxID=875041 RepID=A0A918TXR9_9RHOB|nr:alpha/beta hydrolase [Gemmobacter tilapiae]GHC66902.1 hydrolase [Gemmobacter tilapiae]